MASLVDIRKGRKDFYTLFVPQAFTNDSFRDEEREHMGANHLPDLNKIISYYYAPQRASNSTAVFEDDLASYVTFLEKRNSNLNLRLAELERKFKAIEPYLPYIPTLAKIISDFIAVEARVEEKKKYFKEKYLVKEVPKMKLWAGAEEKPDIADATLDEMLGSVDEDE
ncbi:MAG: hypothetical protein LLF28_07980 [Nitrospiraceae bacterium]|nr:hypothetical protein [Nitrospiraceae bacterium]